MSTVADVGWLREGRWALTLVVVLATGSGVLWALASDGSKEATLSSSLISGAVIGFLLLVVERHYAGVVRDVRESEAHGVLPGATPVRDDRSDEPPARGDAMAGSANEVQIAQQEPDRYEVIYLGADRDTSRVDVWIVRLRVLREGRYVQFVTAAITGLTMASLETGVGDSYGKIWGAAASLTVPRIEDAVRRGELPRRDPTLAFDVRLPHDDMSHALRGATAPRVGDSVGSFEL